MKIKKINDLSLFNKINPEYNLIEFTGWLFHGTRMGILDLHSEELKSFKSDCKKILIFIKENIYKYVSKDVVHRYQNEINSYFADDYRVMRFEASKMFEYDSFYFTTCYEVAKVFSKLGAGELGELTYINAKAIKELNIVFNEIEINELIDSIIERYNKISKTKKVILCVKNVKFVDMQSEEGYPINFDEDKEEIYEAYNNLFEHNNIQINKNLRLLNSDNYTFYIIGEEDINLIKFINTFKFLNAKT